MSHLSRDRALIALAPGALAFARASRAPRAGVAEYRTVACDPAAGPEPWRGAVAALAPLAESLKGERVDATVVLSNHFVRYVLVAPDAVLESDAEELAFARYCFERVHGARSKDWQVRLDRGGAGAARVASAVDDGLVRSLRDCFKSAVRARLVSVQPFLMAAFNRWGRQLPAATSLLLVEPGRACLAHLANGGWSAVHSVRGNFDDPPGWAQLLERERHVDAGGAAPAEVLVHAPYSPESRSLESGAWRFRPVLQPLVKGIATRPDPYLSMALCTL